jgi:hypothetical protein
VYSVPVTTDGVGAWVGGVGDAEGDPSVGSALGDDGAEGGAAELDGVVDGSAPPHAASRRAAARRIGPRRVVGIGQFGW